MVRLVIAMHDVVGVDVVALAVAVGEAQDHPLVEELLEGLYGGDETGVVEHLVPESGVEQVQYRVFGAADVEIHWHPVALLLGVPATLFVVGVDVAQVIPATPSPLRHGVALSG